MTSLSDKFTIRPALPEDAAKFAQFSGEEMVRAAAHKYSTSDLENRLKTTYSAEACLTYISNTTIQIYLATESSPSGQVIVGYTMVGPLDMPLEKCDLSTLLKEEKPTLETLNEIQANSGEVGKLFIHPSQFGNGLAQELMRVGIEWLRNRGFKHIFVGTNHDYYRAQRFYSKLGFQKVGEYEFSFGESHNTVEFILLLKE